MRRARPIAMLSACLLVSALLGLLSTATADDPQSTPASADRAELPDAAGQRRAEARAVFQERLLGLVELERTALAELNRLFAGASSEQQALAILDEIHALKSGGERRVLELQVEVAAEFGLADDLPALRDRLRDFDQQAQQGGER